jgi:hypothetical protein
MKKEAFKRMKLVMRLLLGFLLNLNEFFSQEKENSTQEYQQIQMKEYSQSFTSLTKVKYYLSMMVKSRRFRVLKIYQMNLILYWPYHLKENLL